MQDEVDEKVERLARLAVARGLGGILLNTQPNFAWLTGGRSNQIDGSRENGAGSLLVSGRGQRFVVANNIEMPRLHGETLAGLGFSPCEYAWIDEQRHLDTVISRSRQAVCGEVGCDSAFPGGTPIDAAISSTRALLTPSEIARYRALGRDVGHVIGNVCRALVPDLSELEIAYRAATALGSIGARAIVTLVAADDRIDRFRHPVPTETRWQDRVMIVVCAQRSGLVVALSRIVVVGRLSDTLEPRTRATSRVFGALLGATVEGATGAELFAAAAAAYADAGFPNEETRHHQGGATGYRARDWIAHPASREVVQARQAFAWNPSITGTKVEETAVISDEGLEVVTTSPGWPSMPLDIRGQLIQAPSVLEL